MDQLQALTGLSGAVVVIALSNTLVKPFVTDTRFIPLATVFLGVLWNVGLSLATDFSANPSVIATAVIMGILTGLAATNEFPSNTVLPVKTGTPVQSISKQVGAE